ncbi:helix-turn-helix domain-containing protein [Escherichia coli]|nr:helix-turn-helix domain-containing protein [Escherichia coli]
MLFITGCHDLKSIGEFTGTTRSTTHRLVTVLVEQRYLRHVPNAGLPTGCQTDRIPGARALERSSLYEIAQPVLQRLPVTPGHRASRGSLKATKCCIWRRSTASAGWKCAPPRPSHATGNHRHRQGIDPQPNRRRVAHAV